MAQADNILLATRARMEGAVWQSGPFAPAAPPANLLRNEPSDLLIWTDLTQTWLTGTIAVAKTFRMAWLGYLGCTDAATWRVILRNGGVEVYDSGALDCVPSGEDIALPHRKNRRHCLHMLPAAVTADEWEIEVDDAANPAGVLYLGQLILDDPFQPQRNRSYGATVPSLVDPSRIPTAAPGQRPPLNRAPYDVAQFELRWGSRAEMVGELRNLLEFTGTTKPVLAVLEPGATEYRERMMIYGLLDQLPGFNNAHFNIFQAAFRIEELIP